jgi:Lipocalin-like domain
MANRTTAALFLGALAAASSLIPCTAWPDASAKSLVGTWKLTGWTLRVVGETEEKEPFGPNPKGRLVMTPEGHWIVIITGADRHPAKTAEEKVALFDSVLAYSGKYTIEGDKITVRVEMSTNEVFTGTNQVQTRFFKLEGEKLIVRTPEISSAALPGKKIVGTNIFEREH